MCIWQFLQVVCDKFRRVHWEEIQMQQTPYSKTSIFAWNTVSSAKLSTYVCARVECTWDTCWTRTWSSFFSQKGTIMNAGQVSSAYLNPTRSFNCPGTANDLPLDPHIPLRFPQKKSLRNCGPWKHFLKKAQKEGCCQLGLSWFSAGDEKRLKGVYHVFRAEAAMYPAPVESVGS